MADTPKHTQEETMDEDFFEHDDSRYESANEQAWAIANGYAYATRPIAFEL
jgi:hypothetical protein